MNHTNYKLHAIYNRDVFLFFLIFSFHCVIMCKHTKMTICIINRYVFTEDKIKINDSLFKSKLKTVSGSLSVNPLKEESGFADASGNYITGSISSPLSPQFPLNKIEETDQFNALGRKRQGNDFFYSACIDFKILMI